MMRVSKGKTKSDIYFHTYSPSRFDAAITRKNVFFIWSMVASLRGRVSRFRKCTSYKRIVAGVKSGYFTMDDFYSFTNPRRDEASDRRKKFPTAGFRDEDMLMLIFTAYVDAGNERVISLVKQMYGKEYLGGVEADRYLDLLCDDLGLINADS